jgi:hypothetical protein
VAINVGVGRLDGVTYGHGNHVGSIRRHLGGEIGDGPQGLVLKEPSKQ